MSGRVLAFPPTPNSKSVFPKWKAWSPLKASLFIKFTESKMFIVFVCVQFFKNFGCHYNQRGLLKIEILILLRLARFQNLGTPPIRPSAYKGQPKSATYRSAIRFRSFCEPQLYGFLWMSCGIVKVNYTNVCNADFELDLSHWIKIISWRVMSK